MIALASRCLRRAGFKYCSDAEQEPRPDETDGRSIGQLLHDAQEQYHKAGTVPEVGTDVGGMFRAGLPYLAPPRTGSCEQRREIVIAGHRYTILMDWYGESAHLPGAPENLPAILDHKTSSYPQRYGVGLAPDKPPIEDVQVTLYSAFALVDSRQDKVFGRWLYYPTKVKRKKAIPSDFTLTKGQVEESFGERIYPVSNLLKKVHAERPDPNSLAPNPMACNDFGRLCWFSQENGGPCRLTDQDLKDALARELERGDGMGLRDKAKAAEKTVVADDPGINPPDEIKELPPELKEEEKPAPAAKKPATSRKPKAAAGNQAEDIGKGVLAVLDAIKERWG